jgi:hypothetical protein
MYNPPTNRSLGVFARHYAEMVVVMFAGMFALMAPADWLLGVFGTSSSDHHPTMMLVSMAATMTLPMIAWMRYRGHAWRVNLEMAASMVLPTLGALTLVWAGAASANSVMVPEHAGMLGCMLIAMLLRRDEYSSHRHHAQPALAA